MASAIGDPFPGPTMPENLRTGIFWLTVEDWKSGNAKNCRGQCFSNIQGRWGHRSRRRGTGRARVPKIREKYFSGNYYVKFGHFSGKIM